MSEKLGQNFVHYTADGVFFYDSSSLVTPSTSQSSVAQITQITCSGDLGNNLATTASLSGYFILPLLTSSAVQKNGIKSQLNVVYNTGSFFAVSSSNTNFYHQPTSSDSVINYILPVEIERNESPNLVARKTYNALTSSLVYVGATADNGHPIGYNYISASITGSAIKIFNQFSQSIGPVFISASGFTSNIIVSGSFGSGSATNYLAPRGTILIQSSSLVIARDITDAEQNSFIFRVQSGSFGGTQHRDLFYVSASVGKIGIGTSEPVSDVDIRADEFQIQKKTERRGLKLNNEGNIESFDRNVATANTGSEFILRYSRGVDVTPSFLSTFTRLTGDQTGSNTSTAIDNFNTLLKEDERTTALEKAERSGFLNPAQVGDTLGAVRFIAESGSTTTGQGFDNRIAGEAAVIKAVVSDIDATGTRADLVFMAAGKTGRAVQKFLIDANNAHQLTGSLSVTSDVIVENHVSHRNDSDTRMTFSSSDDAISFTVGNEIMMQMIEDSSQDKIIFGDGGDIDFRIHANNQLLNLNNPSFFVEGSSGKVGIRTNTPLADLNILGNIFASGSGGHITASGNISSSGKITANTLQIANTADGSAKIGNNQILHTGVEASAPNVTAGIATNVNAVATTDNAEFFVGILDGAEGSQAVETSTRLKYNPNVGKLTVSGDISSSSTITSNNINTVGTGSFGRVEATSKVALQVSNSQLIVFENSAGTEFGNIQMNSSDNMVFQNLRSNKDFIMRAGNSGNEGHVIIQPGGDTSTNIAKFGTTAGLDLLGNLTASGNISASGDITANDVYGSLEYWEATARADCDDDTNWQGPNAYGILTRQDWNSDFGTDYDDTTAVNQESRTLWNTGWRVPPDCSASIEGFDIYLNPNNLPSDGSNTYGADFGFSCSLWYSNPDDFSFNEYDGGNSPAPPAGGTVGTFNQRHAATVTDSQIPQSGQLFKFNILHVSQSCNIKIAPGGMVYPRIKTTSSTEEVLNIYWMVKYRKIKP